MRILEKWCYLLESKHCLLLQCLTTHLKIQPWWLKLKYVWKANGAHCVRRCEVEAVNVAYLQFILQLPWHDMTQGRPGRTIVRLSGVAVGRLPTAALRIVPRVARNKRNNVWRSTTAWMGESAMNGKLQARLTIDRCNEGSRVLKQCYNWISFTRLTWKWFLYFDEVISRTVL